MLEEVGPAGRPSAATSFSLCPPHGVVVSTSGEAVGVQQAQTDPEGGHCREPGTRLPAQTQEVYLGATL
jgi:hypothetical protein